MEGFDVGTGFTSKDEGSSKVQDQEQSTQEPNHPKKLSLSVSISVAASSNIMLRYSALPGESTCTIKRFVT
eukprot:6488224-Amphidinium_carterae.1